MDNEYISYIQGPNYEHLVLTQPHRLYAIDIDGEQLELRASAINQVVSDISGKSGVILGMTHFWTGGSQTQTFFLDSEGGIYSVGEYSGLTSTTLNILYLCMLLNPVEHIDGWTLQDIDQAKREQAPKTHPMIGMESSWGKTETVHPGLQEAMRNSIAIIKGIL